jgi:hypothetical protein
MYIKYKTSVDFVKEANESLFGPYYESETVEDSNNILDKTSNNLTVTKTNRSKSLLSVNGTSNDVNIDEKIGEVPTFTDIKRIKSSSYDDGIEKIVLSLSKIEEKIDYDKNQLKKLDQFNNGKKDNGSTNNVTPSTDEKSFDHNFPEPSELLGRMDNLEGQLNNIEADNIVFKKKFINVENTLNRFEDLEKEIKIEYENDEKKPLKNILVAILSLLLGIVSILIISDQMGYVDLYLNEIFQSLFFK